MDIKVPKQTDAISVVVSGVSAVAGAAASNIAVSQILGEKKTVEEGEAKKKEESKRRITKGVAAAASLLGAVFVQGQDTAAQGVRGFLLGAGAQQAIAFLREMVDEKTDNSALVKKAVGLGCPCNSSSLRMPTYWTPSYYQPTYIEREDYSIYESDKPKNLLSDFTKTKTYA